MSRRLPPNTEPPPPDLPERAAYSRLLLLPIGNRAAALDLMKKLEGIPAAVKVGAALGSLWSALEDVDDQCRLAEQHHDGVVSIDTARLVRAKKTRAKKKGER